MAPKKVFTTTEADKRFRKIILPHVSINWEKPGNHLVVCDDDKIDSRSGLAFLVEMEGGSFKLDLG